MSLDILIIYPMRISGFTEYLRKMIIFYYYENFFEAIVCEDGFDKTQFDDELLNDNNWNINDNGDIIGIYIPAIYTDGDILFRYR